MKIFNLLFITFHVIGFTAFGQTTSQKTATKTIPINNTMDTSKLTNETVKKAFEAWQNGDSKTFLLLVTADLKLYDDGNHEILKAL